MLLATASPARGDWLNLTGAETAPNIAEITILDDRVLVALEVYIGDLGTFQALLPDDWLAAEAATERPPLSERLARFSAETLQIRADDGTRLPVRLKLVEPRLRKERYSPYAGMIFSVGMNSAIFPRRSSGTSTVPRTGSVVENM